MIKQTDLTHYVIKNGADNLFAFRRMEKRVRYKCSNCNTYLSDDDDFCRVCGCELVDGGIL